MLSKYSMRIKKSRKQNLIKMSGAFNKIWDSAILNKFQKYWYPNRCKNVSHFIDNQQMLQSYCCFGIHQSFSTFQGLPLTHSDKLQELSGTWEKVFIPVLNPTHSFTVKSSYNLKHIQPGAVYEIVAIAKNAFGWSEYSKVFNFFNKGVGKCKYLFRETKSGLN